MDITPYLSLKPTVAKLLNKAYNNALFGKPYCEQINLMNDLFYLMTYLSLIKDEIAENYTVCEEWDTIMETYKLQCMINRFSCKGINVKPIVLAVLRPDGIGSMAITLGLNDCDSIFTIT